jgi:predicted metal-binding membrane protein
LPCSPASTRTALASSGFVAAWTVTLVVMMLPSAAPFVLLYRRGRDAGGDDPHRSPKRPITLRTFGREGAPNAG